VTNYILMIEDIHRLAHRLLEYDAYYRNCSTFHEFLFNEEPEQAARLWKLYMLITEFYEGID